MTGNRAISHLVAARRGLYRVQILCESSHRVAFLSIIARRGNIIIHLLLFNLSLLLCCETFTRLVTDWFAGHKSVAIGDRWGELCASVIVEIF